MIRVGVVGGSGKMGRVVCAAIVDDPELELVAAVGKTKAGTRLGDLVGRDSVDIVVADKLDALTAAKADVAVDFTKPDAVAANARWYAEHRLNAVIGTSGITAEGVKEIGALATKHGTNVVIGPDFSYGGAVYLAMLRIAARHFPEVELIEQHLPSKADAPSGTTTNTARELAKVRREVRGSASKELVPGARGGEIAGIRVHSLRLSGAPGVEEARFARPGELLTITITAFDREPFATGALIAIKKVGSRPGLTYGLPALLDLDGASI
jgi:4-hydroxy-tetrahydrodipicolinate reductase